MACVENISPCNNDSEMEEGEIVDDLSDISSEEEFLLRQRLQVLENYNHVLERKKAKRSVIVPGIKHKNDETFHHDLSEISATELDDYGYTQITVLRKVSQKHPKPQNRQKKKIEEPINISVKNKDYKKKNHRSRRKLEVKVISESSDESEDEYRNKRKKLADAIIVNRDKTNTSSNEKSSLSSRLKNMLNGDIQEPVKAIFGKSKILSGFIPQVDEDPLPRIEEVLSPVSSINTDDHNILNSGVQSTHDLKQTPVKHSELINLCTENDKPNAQSELIDLCIDDKPGNPSEIFDLCSGDMPNEITDLPQDTVDSGLKAIIEEHVDKTSEKDSDEDLEILRQHALKTKIPKPKTVEHEAKNTENKILSEDEDSDTAELRLICLKSALLKKAIEMKRKQKLQKRRSQSCNMHEDFINDMDMVAPKDNSENNTDIESVDMEIGSDAEEKKENADECAKFNNNENFSTHKDLFNNNFACNEPREDELDEDEDLLRAKLLTSLSKNISSLVTPNIINTIETISIEGTPLVPPKPLKADTIPKEKRIIINLGESDSEGEHEATKNLTKMHMKLSEVQLSEQMEFQKRLDMFLKSTRMAVEKSTLPDVVQQPVPPKPNEKFVAKAVNHLPKSEQIEYKNLVKRMAELEKMKQARQTSMNLANELRASMKDTLKPRNVTIDSRKMQNIDEQINLSRKKIAEESAKMLRLKEEGTKLSQKYKIAATELRNIKTALALNKKQQMSAQNFLARIRSDHQRLLKSSKTFIHSKINSYLPNLPHYPSLQKENNPSKDEFRNPLMQKTVKVSVVNDVKETRPQNPRLSVHIDVSSNKKVVSVPNSKIDQCQAQIEEECSKNEDRSSCPDDAIEVRLDETLVNYARRKSLSSHSDVEKGGGRHNAELDNCIRRNKDIDDYKSPLDALGSTDWEGDPNAILCPFEVDGECKDTDCKYLHTYNYTQ